MSQAEITIPDGTGLEVEQRIRAAFEAVVTDFSGSTPPATTYPIMRWADTANNVLKIRNLANDGWIEFMDLATGEVLTNAATAANALNATNVTTNINGHAITDIFEADGVTVKEATHASEATHAESADTATIANENRGSISSNTSTGSVTPSHNRQVNVSLNSTASANLSQVNASVESITGGSRSQINTSSESTTSSSGQLSQINASIRATIHTQSSQINASNDSIMDSPSRFSQINASAGVVCNSNFSVVGGYHYPWDVPSTTNRKWQIWSNPVSKPTIQIATTLQSNYNFGDYGEYFESLDEQEIPAGYIISLLGKKIRKANSTDKRYLGVISKTAGVILGGAGFCWQGRFSRDEFGGIITQMIPDPSWELWEGQTEEDRPLITVEVEDPDYDPEQEYQDRASRPEWHIVGMLGQIYVRIDDTVQAGDYIYSNDDGIGTKDEAEQGWYVMDVTTPYDAQKGYGVAVCLVK